jgi:hypothetical protein
MSSLEELKNLKKVKGFDIEEFNGVKSKIAEVELTDVEEKVFNGKKTIVRQIIVKTENLIDGKENPIQAIEYVPLKFDKENNEFGIPENSESKAMKMLAFFKAKSFDELIGKECLVVKRVKGDREFLGIQYG